MRKLLALCAFVLLAIPPILSFTASYYLKNHFINNLSINESGDNIQIRRFEYQHGWFSSKAQIDVAVNAQNSLIESQNTIKHGPIIWSHLTTNPSKAFCLYQINSFFDLKDSDNPTDDSSNKGTASTSISYTGKTNPVIHHPGLTLRLFNAQIFADLAEIKSRISAGGNLQANLSANQFEFQDRYNGIYAIQPKLELELPSKLSIPSQLQASAVSVSGVVEQIAFSASELSFASHLNFKNNHYHFNSEASMQRLGLVDAQIDQTTISLIVSGVDEELMAYFSNNRTELHYALSNSQWLVLLKHVSQIIKHLKTQPQMILSVQGLHADQPVKIDFSGRLVSDDQTVLNPFSILENLDMKLDFNIPIKLVNELNRPQLVNFFNLMTDKGLLISKNQSYHSKLSFEKAKLRIAHNNP